MSFTDVHLKNALNIKVIVIDNDATFSIRNIDESGQYYVNRAFIVSLKFGRGKLLCLMPTKGRFAALR